MSALTNKQAGEISQYGWTNACEPITDSNNEQAIKNPYPPKIKEPENKYEWHPIFEENTDAETNKEDIPTTGLLLVTAIHPRNFSPEFELDLGRYNGSKWDLWNLYGENLNDTRIIIVAWSKMPEPYKIPLFCKNNNQ